MSTRGRLTLSYAVMLLVTMTAFATALWVERRSQVREELFAEASSSAKSMFNALATENNNLIQLTVIDTAGVARAAASLARVLSRYPGYVVAFNLQDTVLYASGPIG